LTSAAEAIAARADEVIPKVASALTKRGAIVGAGLTSATPQVAQKRISRDAYAAVARARRDLGACTTSRADARRAREFVVRPGTTLAPRTFFLTTWYVAVTFGRTVTNDSTLFVLKTVEPLPAIPVAPNCQALVGVIYAVLDGLESGALTEQRDGIVVSVELEHRGASNGKQPRDEQKDGTVPKRGLHNTPPMTKPPPDGPAQGLTHTGVGTGNCEWRAMGRRTFVAGEAAGAGEGAARNNVAPTEKAMSPLSPIHCPASANVRAD
jgi:hypothetical protein